MQQEAVTPLDLQDCLEQTPLQEPQSPLPSDDLWAEGTHHHQHQTSQEAVEHHHHHPAEEVEEAVEDHHNHLEVEEEQAEETHQAATHQEVEEEEAVEEIPQEEQEEQEEPNHKHNLRPHLREKPNSTNQGCSMESQRKLTTG